MNEKRLKEFWDKEYKDPSLFLLSEEVSGDLVKFTRWVKKEYGDDVLRPDITVLDAGCGNGRNLLWLNREFRVNGVGFDISAEGITQANATAKKQKWGSKLVFKTHSLGTKIPLPDESVDIVLDMMSSHFLRNAERAQFIKEVARVLKPQGVLFFKSFYAERDSHTKELLAKHAADEENAYIHPKLKVYEYVWDDESIESSFSDLFTMMRKEPSHQHHLRGRPAKRRSVVCYFEKK